MVISGGFILGFQDAFVKASSAYTSYWQFLTIRSILNLILVLLIGFIFLTPKSLIPQNFTFVIIRSLCVGACMICFFSGAVTLDFSLMVAGLYTYPMFVSLMSVIILGEILNFNRLFGILFGLTGSLLILEPWQTDINYVHLLPICAGGFYACNLIIIKKFCVDDSPLALEAIRAFVFIIIGVVGIFFVETVLPESVKSDLPFISTGWPEITFLIIGTCIIASACNLLGNLFIIRGYQAADGSLLAPFDFLYLVFAILWGKLVLGAWPSFFDFLGIILIIFAGVVSSLEVIGRKITDLDKN